METINGIKEPNILTNNNYNTVILNKLSIGYGTKVGIKPGQYVPLINNSLETYEDSVLNIEEGTKFIGRSGEKNDVNLISIRGTINLNGTAENPVILSGLSSNLISYINNNNSNDLYTPNIIIREKGYILSSGFTIDGIQIRQNSILETEQNSNCVIRNLVIKNCKAPSGSDYALEVKSNNAVLSNITINNIETYKEFFAKGIGLLGNSQYIENLKINCVYNVGLDINGDEAIVRNIIIYNVLGEAVGIVTLSKEKGSYISDGVINVGNSGIYVYGSDNPEYSAIIEGVKIETSVFGVEVSNSRSNRNSSGKCVVEISGCDISSGWCLCGSSGDIYLTLIYNKIVSSGDNYYCPVIFTESNGGSFEAINNTFLFDKARSDTSLINLYYGTWNINLDGNSFGYNNGSKYVWSTKNFQNYITVGGMLSEEYRDKNISQGDVSKFGTTFNEDVTGTILDIINDNQYIIKKLFGQDGVMSSTGNYSFSREDLNLDSSGIDFQFKRTYNSLDDKGGILGKGWSLNYEASLEKKEEDKKVIVEIKLPNGSSESYLYNKEKYEALDTRNKLDYDNDLQQYTLTNNNGFRYIFNNDGRMIKQCDKYGNEIQFSYTDTGKIYKIWDLVGREYVFDYSQLLIEKVTSAFLT